MSATRPSNNSDIRNNDNTQGTALATERPWLTDPRYGGMSPASAERSYLAVMKRRAEAGAGRAEHLPDRGANEPPPPKSLADYGLSPDTATVPYEPTPATPVAELPKAPATIRATPYTWIAPTTIPRRDFVYGRHLIRKFVSATVAPGGIGKSSLVITEALAMVSG